MRPSWWFLAALAWLAGFGSAAAASPPVPAPPPTDSKPGPASVSQIPQRQDGAGLRAPGATGNGSATRTASARAQMLKCGQRWSALKRAGTASGTWKEFSRSCLIPR